METLSKKLIATEIPKGYNTVNPFVIIKGDASEFIKFVEKVFDGSENVRNRTPDTDGKLIHAEVRVGNSSILIADSKHDWPFTPAFLQIYVEDANAILEKAVADGATVVTPLSDFYNGYKLARLKDRWKNIWWLYEKTGEQPTAQKSNTDWHNKKPSLVHTTIMEAMRNIDK